MIPYSEFQGLLREAARSDRDPHLRQTSSNGEAAIGTTTLHHPRPTHPQEHQRVRGPIQGRPTILRDITVLDHQRSWCSSAVVIFFIERRLADGRRAARALGGGLMQIGKSKAKVYVETDTG